MSDIKRAARDTEADIKEAWRRRDGESVGDKVADVGDRTRNAVKNAGDEIHERADRASRDAAYERGRIEGRADQRDEDLVDDAGA